MIAERLLAYVNGPTLTVGVEGLQLTGIHHPADGLQADAQAFSNIGKGISGENIIGTWGTRNCFGRQEKFPGSRSRPHPATYLRFTASYRDLSILRFDAQWIPRAIWYVLKYPSVIS